MHGEFKTCIILDEDQAEAVSELRMEINPYAPPQTELDASAGMPEVDKIRRSHLAIEGGIQSMGSVFMLVSLLVLLGAVALSSLPADKVKPGIPTLLAGLGLAYGVVGFGIRRLQTWTRIPAVILSVVGLFRFPMGTLLGGLCLFTLLRTKAGFVLSPAYRDIMQATPHIKRKTSPVVWVLLVILLAVLWWVAGMNSV